MRRRISLTGQNVAVDELQTGAENLRMMARLEGSDGAAVPAAGRARCSSGSIFSTRERRTVATYSGGMRRRLDLACGLVGRASVLFLDEPTTGLDLHSRQAMWEVVAEQVRSGVGIVLTTQYLEEADQLADSIVVIDGGVVVAAGTPTELKRQVADQRLDLVLADAPPTGRWSTRSGAGDQLRRRSMHRQCADRRLGRRVRGVLDEVDPAATGSPGSPCTPPRSTTSSWP